MIIDNTPVEEYVIRGIPVLVKREDLCCPDPGPSFSKMRGVFAHIVKRKEQTIGVLDTFHSKAGWAVAYACQALGKQCVNFWPRYSTHRGIQQQQIRARSMGAELVSLSAGRSAILFHAAKKQLPSGAYLMPNALKIPESVTENAAEAERTAKLLPSTGTLVISISSGTVASGVAWAFPDYDLVFHMGYSRSESACRAYMEDVSHIVLDRARFIDEGYGYSEAAQGTAPFPSNPFYDLKAWQWLHGVVESLAKPIVFWNIGA